MHNSLSALMWLVAGQMVTADNSTTSCWNLGNVVRHLLAQGLTWKSYQRRHNPLIDFTDACSPAQRLNSVPFTKLAEDIRNK
jgi:hypothetical protein